MLHLHGSRWAIRDFLDALLDRGLFDGDDRFAITEARDLYDGVCEDLQRFLTLMPWTLAEREEADRLEAVDRYERQRETGADLLRAAAAKERDALERFRAASGPA